MNDLPPVKRVSFPTGVGDLVVPDPDTNGVVIVRDDSNGEYKRVSKDSIKPLRTETDKLVDDVIGVLKSVSEVHSTGLATRLNAEAVVNAGYRKTKPMSEDEFVAQVQIGFSDVDEDFLIDLYHAGCRFIDNGADK